MIAERPITPLHIEGDVQLIVASGDSLFCPGGATVMRVRFFSILMGGIALSGCAAIQDYHYNWVQRYRADTAWSQCFGTWNRTCSADYREGWKRGYADLSSGACEEPPPVPPQKYWSTAYQSADGRACIEQWYSGWQDGAAAAVSSGGPQFHALPVSPTVAQHEATPSYNVAGEEAPVAPPLRPSTAQLMPQAPVQIAARPEFQQASDQVEVGADASGSGPINVSDNYAVPLNGNEGTTTDGSVSTNNSDEPAAVTVEPYGTAVETTEPETEY